MPAMNDNAAGNRNAVLSRKIFSYLEKHPQAGDTLEGIATWWVAQQRIEEMVDEVAEALGLLVKEGVVHPYESRSGVTIYKVKNQEKIMNDK